MNLNSPSCRKPLSRRFRVAIAGAILIVIGGTLRAEGPGEVTLGEETDYAQFSDEELNAAFDTAIADWKGVASHMFEQLYRWHGDANTEPEKVEKQKWADRQSSGREAFDRAFRIAIELVDRGPELNPSAVGFLFNAVIYRDRTGWRENLGDAVEAILDSGPQMLAELQQIGIDVNKLRLIAGRSYYTTAQFDKAEQYLQQAIEAGAGEDEDRGFLSMIEPLREYAKNEAAARQQDLESDDLPLVRFNTSRGEFIVILFEDAAPNTVASFIKLVEEGFYDGLPFYHVLKDQMIFTGDPDGTGSGHAGFRIPDEANRPQTRSIFRGSLVMAKAPDPQAGENSPLTLKDSASSQFFIALAPLLVPQSQLTPFGRVVKGMGNVATLTKIDIGEKEEARSIVPDYIIDAKVIRKRDHAYEAERL